MSSSLYDDLFSRMSTLAQLFISGVLRIGAARSSDVVQHFVERRRPE